MKLSRWLTVPALLGVVLFSSGCVVHDREVVHDPNGSYAAGYKEGYYDREHGRYWHDKAWVACADNDPHCH